MENENPNQSVVLVDYHFQKDETISGYSCTSPGVYLSRYFKIPTVVVQPTCKYENVQIFSWQKTTVAFYQKQDDIIMFYSTLRLHPLKSEY